MSTVFLAGFVVAACSADGGTNTTQESAMAADAGASSQQTMTTPCAAMGGTCRSPRPENMSCRGIDGAFEVHADLCDSEGGICCVTRDLDGQLPEPVSKYVQCGGVLCPPGSVCSHGVDFVVCASPEPPATAPDAGSCGAR